MGAPSIDVLSPQLINVGGRIYRYFGPQGGPGARAPAAPRAAYAAALEAAAEEACDMEVEQQLDESDIEQQGPALFVAKISLDAEVGCMLPANARPRCGPDASLWRLIARINSRHCSQLAALLSRAKPGP